MYLIGSAVDCDLVLGDPRFPEVHCYLLVTDEGLLIRHLGSPPALIIEGVPQGTCRLPDQTVFQVGPFEFRVRIAEGQRESETVGSPPTSGSADYAEAPAAEIRLYRESA